MASASPTADADAPTRAEVVAITGHDAPATPGNLREYSSFWAWSDGRLAIAVAAVGVAAWWVIGLLEPTPAHPELALTWYVLLLDTVFWGCCFFGGLGLVRGHRAGFAFATAAAVTLLVAVVAFAVSGHHRFGLWWGGQLAAAVAFAGVAATATAISRSRVRSNAY